MSREPRPSAFRWLLSRLWSLGKMTLGVFFLLTLLGCGQQSTVLVRPSPPPVLMLPPTRLASLELKPQGPTLQLSDIERQHRIEAETCGENEEKLIALQRWLESMNDNP